MQSGKEAGLSGSIAGGAETFFSVKNKARTIDGMLSRLTTVLAILFIVISLCFCRLS
ncbi:MAG: preprotein translocase subunit SecG [Clostridiales bacterium]|nr:MAG: preprotein translocase subunit SecG [Clostridiales bacterium]